MLQVGEGELTHDRSTAVLAGDTNVIKSMLFLDFVTAVGLFRIVFSFLGFPENYDRFLLRRMCRALSAASFVVFRTASESVWQKVWRTHTCANKSTLKKYSSHSIYINILLLVNFGTLVQEQLAPSPAAVAADHSLAAQELPSVESAEQSAAGHTLVRLLVLQDQLLGLDFEIGAASSAEYCFVHDSWSSFDVDVLCFFEYKYRHKYLLERKIQDTSTKYQRLKMVSEMEDRF